ncbi:MAG: transketolase [Pseudomonadota bacterium]
MPANKKSSEATVLPRKELANAVRALAMDAVQAANSGHPGMPLGMADIAEVLWNDFLRHNPANPTWFDRDRFVLSNGHGSMLLYAVLHLSGYPLTLDEIRDFRQLGSRTAGHPEYEPDISIETTTGPLGQGLANAVGMALAEKLLAAEFNTPDHTIVDHRTYVFLGDGCLMEGISHEACSLAGTLRLGKLIALYDDNGISIDGDVDGWFTDDTAARFESYGWHVVADVDGHDPEAISDAIETAHGVDDRPTLIALKTVIGYGSPGKAGTAGVHGAPLGDEEISKTREQLGWSHAPFDIPDDVYSGWDAKARGERLDSAWQQRFAAYRAAFPERAAEFERRMRGDLPDAFAALAGEALAEAVEAAESPATRKASLLALNALAPALPELLGGSADLTGSNCTRHAGAKTISADNAKGNYVYFGVREFAMAAIGNGLALHGGFIPYSGTFLTFSDYSRNALRMAALMGIRNVFVFTHDSIGLGEDGPTHQPVEHVASLRLMPNMQVWRPCDTVETLVAWRAAIERDAGPSSLVLTRQGLAFQSRDAAALDAIEHGGYVLVDSARDPDIILIATGSEVAPAVAAAQTLASDGVAARVVSMPCAERFAAADSAYRDAVLPPSCRQRLAVEAGATGLWYQWVGSEGRVIGLDHFGESAPAKALFEKYGFGADNIAAVAREMLGR